MLPSGLLAASPASKLCHACIGVTRMGHTDLKNFQQHARAEIVALCDVDAQHLDTAAQLVPGARRYTDWRELFDKEGDKIDSVNVTVPDHMHFPIAYRAIERGKHLYCQKPMCHDLAEVRKLSEAAIEKGVVTQLGTQHASEIGDRMTVQLLKSGAIGRVKHVYLCSNRAAPNRIKGPRPAEGAEPPPQLNWDLWIGTAPMRPYAPKVYHPATWRGWQDFGTSWCADMGCHILDATWRGLDLEGPGDRVGRGRGVVEGIGRAAGRQLAAERARYLGFSRQRADRRQGTGGRVVRRPDFLPPKEAQAFKATGTLPLGSGLARRHRRRATAGSGCGAAFAPDAEVQDLPAAEVAPRNHYHHFVDACLGGEKTESHFAQTAPMTETILLGTVAIRCFGQKLTWDSAGMKFPGNPDAERYLKRDPISRRGCSPPTAPGWAAR